MNEIKDIIMKCNIIWTNKNSQKSGENLNPEGIFSNGYSYIDLGEVIEIYDENYFYIRTISHNETDIIKRIREQY